MLRKTVWKKQSEKRVRERERETDIQTEKE